MRPEDLLIIHTSSIIDALRKLDDTGRRCLFVVDENSKLMVMCGGTFLQTVVQKVS